MSTMQVTSVNIGDARRLDLGRREVTTGIYKRPVAGPVHIGRLGIAGDLVADAKHHGGPDQAIYVYGGDDYDWWSRELGEDIAPGTFGDNITIAGLASAELAIGDRLKIGREVVLEVSAPRIPCAVLSARMGTGSFVRRFRDAERPGVYCRVISEGGVEAGDGVTTSRYEGDRVPVLDVFRDFYAREPEAGQLRRFLATPLGERARRDIQARFDKLGGAP